MGDVRHAVRHDEDRVQQPSADGSQRRSNPDGNFLKLDNAPSDIDMLITSPPYVTSYEYADLHQLSSLWLGYADDYRDLRNGSIGSAQHDLDFNREIKRLNTVGSQIVFGLFDQDKAIARAAANYFLDMQAVATRCHSLLANEGLALFVIGNTEYKGVRIDNAAHLAESLLRGGFSNVRAAKRKMSGKILTPYRDSIGTVLQERRRTARVRRGIRPDRRRNRARLSISSHTRDC